MTVVVILRNGKGDQPVESRRVKALVGWEVPGLILTGGRATGQAVAQANWISLEYVLRVKRIAGYSRVPSRSDLGEGSYRHRLLDTFDARTLRGQ
jgi:hypothetical protein